MSENRTHTRCSRAQAWVTLSFRWCVTMVDAVSRCALGWLGCLLEACEGLLICFKTRLLQILVELFITTSEKSTVIYFLGKKRCVSCRTFVLVAWSRMILEDESYKLPASKAKLALYFVMYILKSNHKIFSFNLDIIYSRLFFKKLKLHSQYYALMQNKRL